MVAVNLLAGLAVQALHDGGGDAACCWVAVLPQPAGAPLQCSVNDGSGADDVSVLQSRMMTQAAAIKASHLQH